MGQAKSAILTVHALDRAVERFRELSAFDRVTLIKVLSRVYRRGDVYGECYVEGSRFVKSALGNKPIVFVVTDDPTAIEGLVVTTILTLEECHNNGGFRKACLSPSTQTKSQQLGDASQTPESPSTASGTPASEVNTTSSSKRSVPP